MLTLFPRIRPNPLPPPPAKLPEEETPPVAHTGVALSAESAEAGAKQDGVPAVETIVASSRASLETAQPASATAILTDDSDRTECESAPGEPRSLAPELSVLVASLANAGAQPFVVELTDRWANSASENTSTAALPVLEDAAIDSPIAAETVENAQPVTDLALEAAGEPSTVLAAAEPATSEAGDSAPAQPQSEPQADAKTDTPVAAAGTGSAELWIAGTNIFDELDILHEAAAACVAPVEAEPSQEIAAAESPAQVAEVSSNSGCEPAPEEQVSEPEPPNQAAPVQSEKNEDGSTSDALVITGSTIEAAVAQPAEASPPTLEEAAAREEQQASDPLVGAEIAPTEDAHVQDAELAETLIQGSAAEALATPASVAEETARVAEESQAAEPTLAAEAVPALDAQIQNAEPAEAPSQEPATEPKAEPQAEPAQAIASTEPASETTAAEVIAETAPQPVAGASADAPPQSAEETPPPAIAQAKPLAIPPKPKHAEGRFFELMRVPEPEAMEDSGEVEAYASAAAQAHLDAIDDTFVAHAQLLLKGRERGRALDVGTGPGQIVIKLASKLTRWKFIGVDRSTAMIERAREAQANVPEISGRVEFRVADGNSLDFADGTFDLVVCNSVLHHMAEPQNLFSEMARVVKPGGAILLRDLRRPARFEYGSHIRKHGKHYSGEMRRLYVASVQAAYTEEELQKMIAESKLRDVRVFVHGKTHIGFERPLAEAAPEKSKSAAR